MKIYILRAFTPVPTGLAEMYLHSHFIVELHDLPMVVFSEAPLAGSDSSS